MRWSEILTRLFSSAPQSGAAEAKAGGASQAAEAIVIGGGIAGLACARRLSQQNKRVLLLEGRTRLGGRIHSVPLGGATVDLGASWIQGRKRNPISELAEQAGARVVRTDYESLELFDIDGREMTDREHDVVDNAVERTMKELLRGQRDAGPDDSIEPTVRRALDQHGLNATERRGLRWALASEIASEYAVDFHDLSLSQWDEDYEYGGADCQFANGCSMLVDFLASECTRLGVEIRTGAVVRSIDWTPQAVRVETGDRDYETKQAVVTLPLGVLKSGKVKFLGRMPENKQRAIRRLAVGTLNKVIMAFPRRCWPEDAHYFGCLGEANETHMEFWNLEPVTGTPILATLFAGTAAVEMENMSDGDIQRAVLERLRRAFGGDVEAPLAMQVTRWAQDPFCRGAYTHVPPGATYDDYEALAEPIGNRLFFAGEATNGRYPSTLHGAYESGERAAQEVLRVTAA
jgi:monoamine oxidase